MIKVIISLITIYILNIIDYFQTAYAISLYGISVEYNPIARWLLINDLGFVVKAVGVPLILLGMGILAHHEKHCKWAIYILLVYYIFIVMHNWW